VGKEGAAGRTLLGRERKKRKKGKGFGESAISGRFEIENLTLKEDAGRTREGIIKTGFSARHSETNFILDSAQVGFVAYASKRAFSAAGRGASGLPARAVGKIARHMIVCGGLLGAGQSVNWDF